MKNRFSLYTFFLNVFAGLRLGCTESHAKNITSLENIILNYHFFYFVVLEKSLTFSDHLTTFRLAPNDSATLEVVRELFFSDHPLTTAQIANFANI